jgi:hypothetical protein
LLGYFFFLVVVVVVVDETVNRSKLYVVGAATAVSTIMIGVGIPSPPFTDANSKVESTSTLNRLIVLMTFFIK